MGALNDDAANRYCYGPTSRPTPLRSGGPSLRKGPPVIACLPGRRKGSQNSGTTRTNRDADLIELREVANARDRRDDNSCDRDQLPALARGIVIYGNPGQSDSRCYRSQGMRLLQMARPLRLWLERSRSFFLHGKALADRGNLRDHGCKLQRGKQPMEFRSRAESRRCRVSKCERCPIWCVTRTR
jgi:hypothetical protein